MTSSGAHVVFELGICIDDGRLLCPECKRPFSCLPKPEAGCEPVGSVHQDFTSDAFLPAAQCCGVIDDVKGKVYIFSSLSRLQLSVTQGGLT